MKPIVQDPVPVAFGGALVYLDHGFIRPDESNKLVFLQPNELAITDRAAIKGVEANVTMASYNTGNCNIIHDFINDNVLVLDLSPAAGFTFRLSSFDPRSLTLNWTVTLPSSFTFCGDMTVGGAITESYVWLKASTNVRAYSLTTGALVYNFTVATSASVVGGTVPVTILAQCIPISDSIIYCGKGFLNAHNGGSAAPYQAYKLVPLTSTTYQIEAVPGIPGDASFAPSTAQAFPISGFRDEAIIFFTPTTTSTYGQLACGKLNMNTGAFTALVTAPALTYYNFTKLQLDCADLTAAKIWLSGAIIQAGATRSCLSEFTYPGGVQLGIYGGRVQGNGTNLTTNLLEGAFYQFYVVGSYIYAFSSSGGLAAIYLWDVGDYGIEPKKILPLVEATVLAPNDTTEFVAPKNLYFPKLPAYFSGGATFKGTSNIVALRPISKVVTTPLPGLSVPSVAATLVMGDAVTVTLWQKVTWVQVTLDGLNTRELQIVNDGLNETTIGWLYDETGRQVTYNKAFPLILGSQVGAGTYYLALVNVKGDTTSIIAPSNYGFRISINNSPTITAHQLTLRLVRNYK